VLTVLFGESPEVFKQIVEFYFKPESWIVDLTYGDGKLWGAFSNFEEKAEIIYIRTGVGFYRNPSTPQTAHGFYLVFRLADRSAEA